MHRQLFIPTQLTSVLSLALCLFSTMRAFSPARAVWHWILSTSPGPVSAVKAGAVVASLLVTTSLNCASAFCVLPSLTTTYARACHRPATATVSCEASKENTQRRNLLLTSISGVVGSQLAASAAQGRVSWSASVSMSGGESVRPVRVCVVGAGPTYTHTLPHTRFLSLSLSLSLYERLSHRPTSVHRAIYSLQHTTQQFASKQHTHALTHTHTHTHTHTPLLLSLFSLSHTRLHF